MGRSHSAIGRRMFLHLPPLVIGHVPLDDTFSSCLLQFLLLYNPVPAVDLFSIGTVFLKLDFPLKEKVQTYLHRWNPVFMTTT